MPFMRGCMARKYDSLEKFLKTQNGNPSIKLSFAKIANLVGGLPPSAYKHEQWWKRYHRSQGEAWKSAGYHVGKLDLKKQEVTFEI